MPLYPFKAAVAAMALLAAFAGPAVAADKAAAPLKITALGGKFSFTLPPGYVANPMPPGQAANGTAGSTGTMYLNEQQKRVIVATQTPIPGGLDVKENDEAVLEGAALGLVEHQSAALPDFKETGDKKIKLKTLGVRQIDSTATMGGGKTISTTFIAAYGTRMSMVQIISRADDSEGHRKVVEAVLRD